MYDIKKLRRELADNPKQLEVLNLIHLQICHHQTCKRITISIPKSYSSKIKKTVIHLMGYDIPYKKILGEEITIVKIDE